MELKVQPVSEVGALLDASTYDILTTGWSVNRPQLHPRDQPVLGPAGQGGWPYLSDAYYCNAEYDRLYAQQLAELDTGKRAGIVKEMERILYQDNIFVVWGYADGTVNLTSCGRSANHISLIRHTRPGEIAEANRRKSPSDCSS